MSNNNSDNGNSLRLQRAMLRPSTSVRNRLFSAPVAGHHREDGLVVLRLDVVGQQELQQVIADTNEVAGIKSGAGDEAVVDICAVGAMQVTYFIPEIGTDDLGVAPRDRSVVQGNVTITSSPDRRGGSLQLARSPQVACGRNLYQTTRELDSRICVFGWLLLDRRVRPVARPQTHDWPRVSNLVGPLLIEHSPFDKPSVRFARATAIGMMFVFPLVGGSETATLETVLTATGHCRRTRRGVNSCLWKNRPVAAMSRKCWANVVAERELTGVPIGHRLSPGVSPRFSREPDAKRVPADAGSIRTGAHRVRVYRVSGQKGSK